MNSEELVNTTINDVIFKGEQDALRDHLNDLQFALSNNWGNLIEGGIYVNMSKAFEEADSIIAKMKETFIALQCINADHK